MCVKTEATKYGFLLFCLAAGMGITFAGYAVAMNYVV